MEHNHYMWPVTCNSRFPVIIDWLSPEAQTDWDRLSSDWDDHHDIIRPQLSTALLSTCGLRRTAPLHLWQGGGPQHLNWHVPLAIEWKWTFEHKSMDYSDKAAVPTLHIAMPLQGEYEHYLLIGPFLPWTMIEAGIVCEGEMSIKHLVWVVLSWLGWWWFLYGCNSTCYCQHPSVLPSDIQ